MARSWIDTRTLLDSGLRKLFSEAITEVATDKTAVLPVPQPGVQAPIAPAEPITPDASPASEPAQTPAPRPAPTPFRAWEPHPRMSELKHDEPSLASRARPDLPPPDVRHKNFSAAYTDQKASNKSLRRHNGGSANVVFHGQLASGHAYIAKPHEGIGHRDRFHPDETKRLNDQTFNELKNEAPHHAARHDATYELMSAMGAHHMVTPGMHANMHQRHQFKGPDPDEFDSDEKRLTMAAHHAGGLAHVQEFVADAKPVHQSSPEELDAVDAEHRLHGIVSHLLMGNGDGHTANVMVHKSGHPVLIDHDNTLASSVVRGYKEHFGKDSIRSVFAPGGPLDYQAKMPKDASGQVTPVGTNFPPRMKEVLQRAAEGYYDSGPGALSLSPEDKAELKKNARHLLSYGLEGTLERRHDIDAEARAKKAEKAARLGGKK
jgi:hypothetical protein